MHACWSIGYVHCLKQMNELNIKTIMAVAFSNSSFKKHRSAWIWVWVSCGLDYSYEEIQQFSPETSKY